MRNYIKKDKPTKKNIQEVAIKLFAKNGYDDVTVMDICNEAGVNNSMVSYYFGGKMGLYESIIKDVVEKQYEYMKDLISVEAFKQLPSIDLKIEEFCSVLDKFVDFFYKEVSTDLTMLMLREQQNPTKNQNFLERVPWIVYIEELMADITLLPPEAIKEFGTLKNLTFHIISIISIMTSPRIFSSLLNSLIGTEKISNDEIEMVRENVKLYVLAVFGREKKNGTVVPRIWTI